MDERLVELLGGVRRLREEWETSGGLVERGRVWRNLEVLGGVRRFKENGRGLMVWGKVRKGLDVWEGMRRFCRKCGG